MDQEECVNIPCDKPLSMLRCVDKNRRSAMDDDLRAELEKLSAECRTRWEAFGGARPGGASSTASAFGWCGNEIDQLLARHPELAAPSETDRKKAIDEWITKRAEADGVIIKPDMPIEARINTLIAIERLQVLHEAGFTDIEITKSANSGNGFRGMVDAIRAEHAKQIAPSEREKRLERALTLIKERGLRGESASDLAELAIIALGEQAKEA
jgi:hypothetical protein